MIESEEVVKLITITCEGENNLWKKPPRSSSGRFYL